MNAESFLLSITQDPSLPSLTPCSSLAAGSILRSLVYTLVGRKSLCTEILIRQIRTQEKLTREKRFGTVDRKAYYSEKNNRFWVKIFFCDFLHGIVFLTSKVIHIGV